MNQICLRHGHVTLPEARIRVYLRPSLLTWYYALRLCIPKVRRSIHPSLLQGEVADDTHEAPSITTCSVAYSWPTLSTAPPTPAPRPISKAPSVTTPSSSWAVPPSGSYVSILPYVSLVLSHCDGAPVGRALESQNPPDAAQLTPGRYEETRNPVRVWFRQDHLPELLLRDRRLARGMRHDG